jgi:hypothetical protein
MGLKTLKVLTSKAEPQMLAMMTRIWRRLTKTKGLKILKIKGIGYYV